MAQFTFDANQYEPNEDRITVPAGWYAGMITKTEMQQTSKKDGYFIKVIIRIVEGPYKDCTITERFNVNNKNADTQRIALAQLSSLCRCVGVMVIQDTTQLHNIPFKFKAELEASDDPKYGDQNSIKAYKPMSFEIPLVADAPKVAVPHAAPVFPTTQAPTQPAPVPQVAPQFAPVPQPQQAPVEQPQWQPPVQPVPQAAPVQQAPQFTPPVQPAPVAPVASPAPQATMTDLPPWMQQAPQ